MNPIPLLEKAGILFNKGYTQLAIETAKIIINQDPKNIQAWAIYRHAHQRRNVFFKKASMFIDSLLSLITKIHCIPWLNKFNYYLLWIRIYPQSRLVLDALGQYAYQNNCKQLAEWAWETNKNYLNPKYQMDLANIYIETMQNQKALDLAESVLKRDPYASNMMDVVQTVKIRQSMQASSAYSFYK